MSTLAVLHSGAERDVCLYGDVVQFNQWLESVDRPKKAIVIETLAKLAELSAVDLLRMGKVWKFQADTNPKIYAVKKDQVRLYCCLKGKDIVIIEWNQKKQNQADRATLKRAQKRAREVLDQE